MLCHGHFDHGLLPTRDMTGKARVARTAVLQKSRAPSRLMIPKPKRKRTMTMDPRMGLKTGWAISETYMNTLALLEPMA